MASEAASESHARREHQLQGSCLAKIEQLRRLHERELAAVRAEVVAQPRDGGQQRQQAAEGDEDAAAALAAMERHLGRLSAALRDRDAQVAALQQQLALGGDERPDERCKAEFCY